MYFNKVLLNPKKKIYIYIAITVHCYRDLCYKDVTKMLEGC